MSYHLLVPLERHFHALIRERAGDLLTDDLVLPSLAGIADAPDRTAWFPVPGMYGGFSYRLAEGGETPMLVVESWCRIVEGSDERHEVTGEGYRRIRPLGSSSIRMA